MVRLSFMMSQGEEKDLERTMKNWTFSELLNFKSILKEQWLQAIICKLFLFVFFSQGLPDLLNLNNVSCVLLDI